jgi:hypothetical protein
MSMKISHVGLAVVLSLALVATNTPVFAAPPVTAKVGTITVASGDVSGSVYDLDGTTVRSSVDVVVKDAEGEKVVAEATTGKDGSYTLTGLEEGSYMLLVDGQVKAVLDVTPEAKVTTINVVAPEMAEPYAAGQWEGLAGFEMTSVLLGAGASALVVGPISYEEGEDEGEDDGYDDGYDDGFDDGKKVSPNGD